MPQEMVANFRAKHTVSEEPLALFLAEQAGTAAEKLNKHNYSQNVLQLDVNLYALPTVALAFLANHSCQPNTYFATDTTGLYLRALMPIPKGTEITFDYASMIFDEYTLTCLGGLYGGCKKPDGACQRFFHFTLVATFNHESSNSTPFTIPTFSPH